MNEASELQAQWPGGTIESGSTHCWPAQHHCRGCTVLFAFGSGFSATHHQASSEQLAHLFHTLEWSQTPQQPEELLPVTTILPQGDELV